MYVYILQPRPASCYQLTLPLFSLISKYGNLFWQCLLRNAHKDSEVDQKLELISSICWRVSVSRNSRCHTHKTRFIFDSKLCRGNTCVVACQSSGWRAEGSRWIVRRDLINGPFRHLAFLLLQNRVCSSTFRVVGFYKRNIKPFPMAQRYTPTSKQRKYWNKNQGGRYNKLVLHLQIQLYGHFLKIENKDGSCQLRCLF